MIKVEMIKVEMVKVEVLKVKMIMVEMIKVEMIMYLEIGGDAGSYSIGSQLMCLPTPPHTRQLLSSSFFSSASSSPK